jgi:hypothetical protein
MQGASLSLTSLGAVAASSNGSYSSSSSSNGSYSGSSSNGSYSGSSSNGSNSSGSTSNSGSNGSNTSSTNDGNSGGPPLAPSRSRRGAMNSGAVGRDYLSLCPPPFRRLFYFILLFHSPFRVRVPRLFPPSAIILIIIII